MSNELVEFVTSIATELPAPVAPATGLSDAQIVDALRTDSGAIRAFGHLTEGQGKAVWLALMGAGACVADQRSLDLAVLAVRSAVIDMPSGPARMAQSLRLLAIYVARGHYDCHGADGAAEALRVSFSGVPRR